MKRFSLTAILVFGLAAAVTADSPVSGATAQALSPAFGVPAVRNPFSLLDLSRVKWSHSYSVSFFSGGGGSGTLGILNSTMFYPISNSLSLTVNLGIAHSGGAIWGDAGSKALLLPGFHLNYHPSENFQMSVTFQRVAGGVGPYYAPGYGWYGRR